MSSAVDLLTDDTRITAPLPLEGLHVLSLCSGIGGLDLALRTLGARTVCYVEKDPFCARVLEARIRDGWLDDAPIWDDLATLDGRPWRGSVDLVAGGVPCQGNSSAGKQRGRADERWLWPHMRKIARDVGCRYLLLENVAGLLAVERGGALGEILGELAEDGFSVRWDCVRASDVGAPHRRERVFLWAERG